MFIGWKSRHVAWALVLMAVPSAPNASAARDSAAFVSKCSFSNGCMHPKARILNTAPFAMDLTISEVQFTELSHERLLGTSPMERMVSTRGPVGHGVQSWFDALVPPAAALETNEEFSPPTEKEIAVLQQAFDAFYGKDRNPVKAEELFTKAIAAWERQGPDEQAGLYRVRGDCYMALGKANEAISDFSTALKLLDGPGGELADPGEKPLALLGRARTIRSKGIQATKEELKKAEQDYRVALRLSSREDWDTDQEREEDGASRNPYAAWEWGMVKRNLGDYVGAADTHALAANSFSNIGDKPRSIISYLDAGIDMAAGGDVKEARNILSTAIESTTKAESRDVALLQRVVTKEGEARVALASILWSANDEAGAETQLGDACVRLEQLETDAYARSDKAPSSATAPSSPGLKFSIDDELGAGQVSCFKFKNQKFLSDTLMWPESLRQRVTKFELLEK